jgi:hypothetical protein
MTVDLSKIKPGDEITISATVDTRAAIPFDEFGTVAVRVNGCLLIVQAREIASHVPRLAVGDRVKLDTGGRGFIRAIIGQRAWVDLVDDPDEHLNGYAAALSSLERVP